MSLSCFTAPSKGTQLFKRGNPIGLDDRMPSASAHLSLAAYLRRFFGPSSSTPPATPHTNGQKVAPARAHHAHCLVLGSSAMLPRTRGHEQVTELGVQMPRESAMGRVLGTGCHRVSPL